MPPELCDQHDIPLDDSGCWACGHGGPIGEVAWPSWERWVLEGFGQRIRYAE